MVGRVVDPLGNPLDGKGPIVTDKRRLVESTAPGIVERQPVKTPLQTLDFPDYLFQVHSEQYSEPPCKNPPLRQVQT